MTELLPCPFCGDSDISVYGASDHGYMVRHTCKGDSLFTIEIARSDKPSAIAAWNRRTPPTPPTPSAAPVGEPHPIAQRLRKWADEHTECSTGHDELLTIIAALASAPIEARKPLTDEQVGELCDEFQTLAHTGIHPVDFLAIVRTIERAHGINHIPDTSNMVDSPNKPNTSKEPVNKPSISEHGGVEVDERAAFERAMNNARFFPRELDFSRGPSLSGRDEYLNAHLQSCWFGWQARAVHGIGSSHPEKGGGE